MEEFDQAAAMELEQNDRSPGKMLGEILLQNGGLKTEQLSEGLARQRALAARRRHYPLGRILVGLGYLRADALAAALAHQTTGTSPSQPKERDDLAALITCDAVRIQEEERRRISVELHDDVAQVLGNLVLMMDACLALAPANAGQLRRYLTSARDTAKGTFRRVQRFALDLRPPMLDDLGLAPTIVWYAERFSSDTDVEVAVNMSEALPGLSDDQQSALFRVLQEALRNVREHAHAKHVTISLEARSDKLRLTIADDGVGATAQDALHQKAEDQRLGFASMRYRVALLNGSFSVEANRGGGTRIVAEIPVGDQRGS